MRLFHRLATIVMIYSHIGITCAQDGNWRALPLVEDGKIANGWKFTGYGDFEPIGAMLKTKPDARGLGLLYYATEKFGDCEIKVVFRRENAKANSGVYIRIDDGILTLRNAPPVERNADGTLSPEASETMEKASQAELGPWYAVHHGFEVQIAGSTDPLHGTGSVYSLAATDGATDAEAGNWQTMIISLDGEEIRVALNGKPVSSFDGDLSAAPGRKFWHEPKREAQRPLFGYIGLQTHDPEDFVTYREVSVRPLQQRTK